MTQEIHAFQQVVDDWTLAWEFARLVGERFHLNCMITSPHSLRGEAYEMYPWVGFSFPDIQGDVTRFMELLAFLAKYNSERKVAGGAQWELSPLESTSGTEKRECVFLRPALPNVRGWSHISSKQEIVEILHQEVREMMRFLEEENHKAATK